MLNFARYERKVPAVVIALVGSVAIRASAESSSSDLEAKVNLLSSEIAKLKDKNSELEMKVLEMQASLNSSNYRVSKSSCAF